MDGMQTMKDLLQAFGATVGIANLAPDESGYTCLSVDEAFVIHLVYDEDSDSLRMFSELCDVSSACECSVMRALLDANVLWRGSNGATFGLDLATKVVTLAYQEPIVRFSPARFEQVLEAFIVTSEHWIKQLAEISNERLEEPCPSFLLHPRV